MHVMTQGRRYCMALSIDVDRFSNAKLRKDYCTPGCGILLDGKVPTVEELRIACAKGRAKGLEVFPPCDQVDDRGHCTGHEEAPR